MAPTPGFDTETSDLSEYEEEEEEDESEYDYGDSDAPKRPKKKKAPKRAKGHRLDGMEGDAMPEHWSRLSKADMEQYEMELQRQNAERRWIKAKENKLSAKLGRKLDQSEKNMIRMCLVS
jgi:hypothetical protein